MPSKSSSSHELIIEARVGSKAWVSFSIRQLSNLADNIEQRKPSGLSFLPSKVGSNGLKPLLLVTIVSEHRH